MRKKFDCNDKIYIDRTESKFNHCQIQNDDEVFNFLHEKGFQNIKLENYLSLNKYIFLIMQKLLLELMVQHLQIWYFCKPNTKIIEIRPPTQINNNYKRISQIGNLNYRLIKTKELGENQKKLGDIYLPTKELEHCIKSFA